MKYKLLSYALTVLALACAVTTSQAQDKKPNILVIIETTSAGSTSARTTRA